MTSKEIIAELQKQDPEGDTECCVGNRQITSVCKIPAYYDGSLLIENDEGAKYKRQGSKISFYTFSLDDKLFDHPDLKIDYSELSKEAAEQAKRSCEKEKLKNEAIHFEINQEYFLKYFDEKTASDGFIPIALIFLDHNYKELFDKTKISKYPWQGHNWIERTEMYWDECLRIEKDVDGEWIISWRKE